MFSIFPSDNVILWRKQRNGVGKSDMIAYIFMCTADEAWVLDCRLLLRIDIEAKIGHGAEK